MAKAEPSDVLAAWETSSQYWNIHRTLIEQMFAPLTRVLIEDARVTVGQSVIDIGGGSGEPSLTVASLIGDSGRITYTDPSAGMVKAARDEAERRGLTNIRFHQCPAEQLPFPDNSFDVALSRLSAMFFPDVLAGLREMLRVIRPDGVLSFVVWGARESNPFFLIVNEILDAFVPTDPEDVDAPHAFRFARPGKLTKLLQDAGAVSLSERMQPFKIEAPMTASRFWEFRTEMSDTFRSKLKTLELEKVLAVKEQVEKAASRYVLDGQMNFPAEVLVVTGSKPI
ncbi:MAG: class I SAM-dependent methyltransferase [Pyrinomonadaceae bacterium]